MKKIKSTDTGVRIAARLFSIGMVTILIVSSLHDGTTKSWRIKDSLIALPIVGLLLMWANYREAKTHAASTHKAILKNLKMLIIDK